MNNQVQQVMNNLNDEQKDQLLQAFITNEFFKKTNEINKNYKDENKTYVCA